MECNKDEAKRAMDIAERKITEKDYNGAKKFANKAQNLFPELDYLKQLLKVIDVYISGEKKICGETDWYGILGVDPFANDEAVKKQYRKLALMLHPDKNKCNGAEDAFKLVKEAWTLLSDKDKRLSYNIKMGKEVQQRFPTTQSEIPPQQPTSNGIQNVRKHVVPSARATSKPAAHMDRSRVDSPAFVSSMPEESSTFWTKCLNCNTQYEHLRVYLNQTLHCPNCSHGFIAEEKTPPSNVPKPPINLSSNQQHMSSKNQASNKKSHGPSRREPAPSVNSDLRNFKRAKTDDSYFHNFDLDRSGTSFKDDQIWAAYGAEEGMPRFYARIQKVISLNPFKMKISWLNSIRTSEFGPIDWRGAGFAKTCGGFRSGRYESSDTLNAFSHIVDFTRGARGVLHILPKKGQVWALYRNWSPEWDKNTPDKVKRKYEMVEVLDDYTEDKQSVTVTLLLKAEGFRAVFRRSTDENDVREIAKEEMFRFSHQVPHYILTGKEADNAPEGCLELDPAATPSELSSENAEANEKSEAVKEKSSVPEEEVGMDLD